MSCDAVERERLDGWVLRRQLGPHDRRLFDRHLGICAVRQRNEDPRPIAAATFVRGRGKDFLQGFEVHSVRAELGRQRLPDLAERGAIDFHPHAVR